MIRCPHCGAPLGDDLCDDRGGVLGPLIGLVLCFLTFVLVALTVRAVAAVALR